MAIMIVSWLVIGLLVSIPSRSGNAAVQETSAPTTAGPSTTRAQTTVAPATTTSLPATTTSAAPDSVALGISLAARNGCAACHSADGSPLAGPTWLGLWGKEEILVDGSTVLVDEAYLRESILDPNAKIVDGFPPDLMPKDFADKLSDTDMSSIIAYIRSLG